MPDPLSRLTELICTDRSVVDVRRSPQPIRGARPGEAGAPPEAFALLFEHVPLGIFLSDASRPELPVIYANPALGAMTGADLAEITGAPCLSWQRETGPTPSSVELREALDRPEAERRFSLKHRGPDGRSRWHELTLSPVRDDAGRLAYVIGICTDVTKRREAEYQVARQTDSLRKSQETLKEQSRILRETNRMLRENQAQLVHTEKMASVGQLAAGVAHEINNPIGFIRSNLATLSEYLTVFKRLFAAYAGLEAAAEARDAAAVERALAPIRALRDEEDLAFVLEDVDLLAAESLDGAERVREIVQNLKSFARIDEAEVKEADINDGLRATLRMVRNELKYKCTVVEELQPLPPIPCFPGQLNQVFMNLLLNASQAIEEQGTITVATACTGDEIVVRIRDTGCGIPEENMPKLFNPFFTTKPVGQGTGLGLSISYSIVKKHGGRIVVESEVGRGTTFAIHLPIRPNLGS